MCYLFCCLTSGSRPICQWQECCQFFSFRPILVLKGVTKYWNSWERVSRYKNGWGTLLYSLNKWFSILFGYVTYCENEKLPTHLEYKNFLKYVYKKLHIIRNAFVCRDTVVENPWSKHSFRPFCEILILYSLTLISPWRRLSPT